MTPLELAHQREAVLITASAEGPGYALDSPQGRRLLQDFVTALEHGWMAREYARAVAEHQARAPLFWAQYANL